MPGPIIGCTSAPAMSSPKRSAMVAVRVGDLVGLEVEHDAADVGLVADASRLQLAHDGPADGLGCSRCGGFGRVDDVGRDGA